jgi:hypothetical protein
MEKTPFELTPEQQVMLASLALETGKPIPALLAEALQKLQEQERPGQAPDDGARESATRPRNTRKPIWEALSRPATRFPMRNWSAYPPIWLPR